MKARVVARTLGQLTVLLGLAMLVPGAIAAFYGETLGVLSFIMASLTAIGIGLMMMHLGADEDTGHKEAFAIVSFSWLLAALLGSLPFVFLGLSPLDSLFESMSGFTTAGATTLADFNSQGYWVLTSDQVNASIAYALMDGASRALGSSSNIVLSPLGKLLQIYPLSIDRTFYGLLFWRSFIQLLGGMGIILLFLAVLPHLGIAGRQLYSVEGLGLKKEALTPRVKNTAKTFWSIYLGMVAIEALILKAIGLPLYDSFCTAFTSLATGGFSPKAYSIAAYNSVPVEAVVCIFLILGGTNFILYYRIIFKMDPTRLIKDPEFKLYLLILGAATAILMIWGRVPGDNWDQFRFSSFQAVSTMTTTGFVNNFTYDAWSLAAKLTLIILMLIGGCTGSTGGGIKVGRVLIILKYVEKGLVQSLHPRAVKAVKLGTIVVDDEIVQSVLLYTVLYFMIFLFSALLFAISESATPNFNAISAISASACCLGVVGPGFGLVALDFSQISQAGRLLGFTCMYMGRLEIIPVLLLIFPGLWKK
jgi:trk system potassium uptake protein TrkH